MASTQQVAPPDNSIYDEILQLQDESKVPACTIGAFLQNAEPDVRDGLNRAFGNREISSTTISKVLERRGLRLSTRTVQRHRAGGCSCPRELA